MTPLKANHYMLKPLIEHQLSAQTDLQRTAIIDVGSNSFRLIVMTYLRGYHFQLTDEVRESVRLVQGLGATGRLSREAMAHAVDVMRLYAAFCRASGIEDILAVATSAVREASNRAEFLSRVQRETGIRVRLLSGEEEAYYGYLAAVNSTTLRDGFVIDLGGGSLEITRVEDRLPRESISLTLGAVRTTEDWLPNIPPTKEQVTRLRKHIRDQLAPLDWFRLKGADQLVAQGGSLRNLARIAQKQRNYPLDELHGYELPAADVRKIAKQLEGMTLAERLRMSGMKPDRADIALAAAIVIEECLRHAEAESLLVCSQGLREGLFYERFFNGNADPSAPPMFENVREASVINVAHLYHFQERHARHVAHLSLSMFDQLAALENDPERFSAAERELLWAACILHDIGMNIDYNDHHRHSYYLILNSGLPGFTHRELALIALAAKYHRKGTPSTAEIGAVLQTGDEARLLRMTALLRLAEQLDRSRDGAVSDVRLEPHESGYLLTPISTQDISVAVWSAQLHTDIFKSAFGKPLSITYGA
jgi:exopolyphosphatase/guanosine-5'-triphosphate,3'-diphosphate pyrophosphatase